MGAPKLKWNDEEEAALKAGVRKHGTGKWRTILSDPEFSSILSSRSNVDLKDKWRNINVTAIWGSRQKAKVALKRDHQKDDSGQLSRLENLILEAIMKLKEPSGSDKASIALYIKDQESAPENFRKLLAAKLKLLTANETLRKVNRKYRLTLSSTKVEARKKSPLLLPDGSPKPKDSSKTQRRKVINNSTESEGDSELANERALQEAAVAAAQAVAQADFAIMEANRAAREAQYAEAKAEAAVILFKAAKQALRCGIIHA